MVHNSRLKIEVMVMLSECAVLVAMEMYSIFIDGVMRKNLVQYDHVTDPSYE